MKTSHALLSSRVTRASHSSNARHRSPEKGKIRPGYGSSFKNFAKYSLHLIHHCLVELEIFCLLIRQRRFCLSVDERKGVWNPHLALIKRQNKFELLVYEFNLISFEN